MKDFLRLGTALCVAVSGMLPAFAEQAVFRSFLDSPVLLTQDAAVKDVERLVVGIPDLRLRAAAEASHSFTMTGVEGTLELTPNLPGDLYVDDRTIRGRVLSPVVTTGSLTAKDSTEQTTETFSVEVVGQPDFAYPTVASVKTGSPVNLAPASVVNLIGGRSPTWTIDPISLPAGLSFSTSTGVVSGTPTAAAAARNYSVGLVDSDDARSSLKTLRLTVELFAKFFGSGNSIGTSAGTSSAPVAVPALETATQIVGGREHSCALFGSEAWCWGANAQGQLGNASYIASAVPVLVAGGHSFQSLIAGHEYSCGVRTDNQVYCWGSNQYSMLGNAIASNGKSNVPVRLGGTTGTVKSLVGGFIHGCFISGANDVYCWGWNDVGQVGFASGTSYPTPTKTAVSNASKLYAGHAAVCAISGSQTICWGGSGNGQLGVVASRTSPVTVTGLAGAAQIGIGDGFVCALVSSAARCAGANGLGQLGNDSGQNSSSFVSVKDGAGYSSISVQQDHACGMKAGKAYCWGRNVIGEVPGAVVGGFAKAPTLAGSATDVVAIGYRTYFKDFTAP